MVLTKLKLSKNKKLKLNIPKDSSSSEDDNIENKINIKGIEKITKNKKFSFNAITPYNNIYEELKKEYFITDIFNSFKLLSTNKNYGNKVELLSN